MNRPPDKDSDWTRLHLRDDAGPLNFEHCSYDMFYRLSLEAPQNREISYSFAKAGIHEIMT